MRERCVAARAGCGILSGRKRIDPVRACASSPGGDSESIMKELPPLVLVVLVALLIAPPARPQVVQLQAPKNHGGYFSYAFSPDGATIAGGTGIAAMQSDGRREVFGGEVL